MSGATHSLDVNIVVDGNEYGSGYNGFTFDVRLGGSVVSNDVKDYYNSALGQGTEWALIDIKHPSDYVLTGSMDSYGNFYGVLNADTVVKPIFTKPILEATEYFNNNKYEFYSMATRWDSANQFAKGKGGHLATITSKEEQAFIASKNKVGSCWLGGVKNKNVWEWQTGEPFEYTCWADGQPDNNKGWCGEGEAFLGTFPEKWNDYPRYLPTDTCAVGFIVEYEHGHEFTKEGAKTDPTCTSKGSIEYICEDCGEKIVEEIPALGHDYVPEVIPATCVSSQRTRYTCSRCEDSYDEINEYTEWSTEKPTGVDEDKIESRVEYCYSDYETKESTESKMEGYTPIDTKWKQTASGTIKYVASWPSGFEQKSTQYAQYNKTPKATSETSTKRVTATTTDAGYLYWHWCKNESGLTNHWISDCYESSYWLWHCYESTTNQTSNSAPDGSNSGSSTTFYAPNGDCCQGTYWYLKTPIKQQNWKEETKYTVFARWTEDSEWSETPVTETDTRKVKTRTVYRTELVASHNYVYGICTVCGDKLYDAKKATITVATVSANPGDTVVVPVTIQENAGFAGFTFDIKYPSAFELTKISKGQLLKQEDYGSLTPNVSGNKVTWTSSIDTVGNGEILTLTFKVNSSSNGKIALELTDGEETNFVDEDGHSIYLAITPGGIEKGADVTLGDVNSDGEIDAADAGIVSRYDAGFVTLTEQQLLAGDVNHDGEVDAADAGLISRYDAGFITSF